MHAHHTRAVYMYMQPLPGQAALLHRPQRMRRYKEIWFRKNARNQHPDVSSSIIFIS